MEIKSLGYRTDLIFPRFEGEVIDRRDYIVVRTPSNPTHHWGNFLLFPEPPVAGDLERWQRLFAQEVGAMPGVRHMAFGWDTIGDETGEAQAFLGAGFRLNPGIVLSAEEVCRPPKFSDEIEVRPLRGDGDWAGALETQIACREEFSLAGYTVFKTRQMERYRAMAAAGKGEWFGAFLDGRVAGDLGVFVEDGVGRFQSVGTHPDFRRRGVCGTLVFEAARYALAHLDARELVMVADADYHAAGIYESVGFRPTEHQWGLDRWEQPNP